MYSENWTRLFGHIVLMFTLLKSSDIYTVQLYNYQPLDSQYKSPVERMFGSKYVGIKFTFRFKYEFNEYQLYGKRFSFWFLEYCIAACTL